MTIIILLAAVLLLLLYGFMAYWFHFGYSRKMPLCGFALSPDILKRIEERLLSEGKPVPRWVKEGMKRTCGRGNRNT